MRGDIFKSLYLVWGFGTYMFATELKGSQIEMIMEGPSQKQVSARLLMEAQGKGQGGQHLLVRPL